jgi:hypothetical protein
MDRANDENSPTEAKTLIAKAEHCRRAAKQADERSAGTLLEQAQDYETQAIEALARDDGKS